MFFATPLMAQPTRGEGGRTVTFTIPQFVAHAVSFKALDETGWDRLGSDEVHLVFVDFNGVREKTTSIIGDVDAGESKRINANDACIAPQPACDHGASSLHFAVAMWESDWSLTEVITGCYPTAIGIHPLYDDGICPGDDLIGRIDVPLTQAQLVAALPNVGDSADTTVKPTGGAGSYTFTYRITRLANIKKTVVIGPERPQRIVAQAKLLDPPSAGKVSITWTGATAASVDILRGAALVATTPNDGEYTDRVNGGTYQYRVCNAGSTTCSVAVSITVP